METYVWYVIIAVGYISFSLGMLKLNNRWDWIYGLMVEIIGEKLVSQRDDPIEMGNLESDPGLVFVLIILGPILLLFSIISAIVLAVAAFVLVIILGLFFQMTFIFPRWIINRAVGK